MHAKQCKHVCQCSEHIWLLLDLGDLLEALWVNAPGFITLNGIHLETLKEQSNDPREVSTCPTCTATSKPRAFRANSRTNISEKHPSGK